MNAVPSVAVRHAGRVLGWSLICLGPVLSVVLVLSRPPTAPTPPPAAAPAGEVDGMGVAGWAELYVRAWLSSNRDTAAALQAFYPDAVASQRPPATQLPVGSTVLAVHEPQPGRWSVVIAAEVLTIGEGSRTTTVRCVQAAVAVASPGRYVALALPALVSCPERADGVALGYPAEVTATGALGQSVAGFLTAYLTGDGDLARYTSPGTTLTAIAPPPLRAVRLEQLRTRERFEPGAEGRPADGTTAAVLARVHGTDPADQDLTADYALTVTARAGRWEITVLDPVPRTTR